VELCIGGREFTQETEITEDHKGKSYIFTHYKSRGSWKRGKVFSQEEEKKASVGASGRKKGNDLQR